MQKLSNRVVALLLLANQHRIQWTCHPRGPYHSNCKQ